VAGFGRSVILLVEEKECVRIDQLDLQLGMLLAERLHALEDLSWVDPNDTKEVEARSVERLMLQRLVHCVCRLLGAGVVAGAVY